MTPQSTTQHASAGFQPSRSAATSSWPDASQSLEGAGFTTITGSDWRQRLLAARERFAKTNAVTARALASGIAERTQTNDA
jgi:hypothetical protein